MSSKAAYKVHKDSIRKALWRLSSRLLSLYQNKPLFLSFFVFKTKLRAFVSLCLKSNTIRIIRKSVAY